jgi:hypothetical protein
MKRAEAAEARARQAEAERDDEIAHRWKLEAVVEAARLVDALDADAKIITTIGPATDAIEALADALAAYDEPPTEQGCDVAPITNWGHGSG